MGAGRNQAAIATATAISAMTIAMIVGNRDGPLDEDGGPCGGQPDGAVGPGPYGACDMHAMVSLVFAGALFTFSSGGRAPAIIAADQG